MASGLPKCDICDGNFFTTSDMVSVGTPLYPGDVCGPSWAAPHLMDRRSYEKMMHNCPRRNYKPPPPPPEQPGPPKCDICDDAFVDLGDAVVPFRNALGQDILITRRAYAKMTHQCPRKGYKPPVVSKPDSPPSEQPGLVHGRPAFNARGICECDYCQDEPAHKRKVGICLFYVHREETTGATAPSSQKRTAEKKAT